MPFYEDFGSDFSYFSEGYTANMHALHMHPHYEMLVILDPISVRTFTNSQQNEFERPFVSIYAPFCLHKVDFFVYKKIRRTAFYFGKQIFSDYPGAFSALEKYLGHAHLLFYLTQELAEELRPLIMQCLQCNDYPQEQKLLFLIILNRVLEKVPEQDIVCTKSASNYINDVIHYLYEHSAESITVGELAGKFFISRSKLCNDFKIYTGETIHQILLEIRISQAVYILRYEKWESISEVATRVGLGNGYRFYPIFKKMTGMTPTEYAKRYRQHYNNS